MENLLQSLLEQCNGFSELMSIIVVTSGSTDRTPHIVKKYASLNHKIRYVWEDERKGKAEAVNRILSLCEGEVTLFISADTLPASGSIENLLKGFVHPVVGATSGHPIPVNNPKSLFGRIARLIWNTHHEIAAFETRLKTFFHISGEMCAIRNGIVEKVPEDIINEDTFIGWEIKKKGYEVVYVPEAVVYMKAPESVGDLYRQRKRVVQGHLQVHKRAKAKVTTVNPLQVIFFLTKSLQINARDLLALTLATFVETLAHIKARIDLRRDILPYKWTTVNTTKVAIRLT